MPYELLPSRAHHSSVANNTREDGRDFLNLVGQIPPSPSTGLEMEDANQALIALNTDAIRGAAVLRI
jgi:hypothetical protein